MKVRSFTASGFLSTILLCAGLFIATATPSRADDGQPIFLKTGRIDTAEQSRATLNSLTAAGTPGQFKHYIVQFRALPTVTQRKGLESSGLKLLSYLGSNAYIASARTASTLGDLSAGNGIRWACPVAQVDRLAPEAHAAEILGESKLPDGRYRLYVRLYEDVSLSTGEVEIQRLGATIQSWSAYRLAIVAAPAEAVAQIAALDIVDWVEPVGAAPVPNNIVAASRSHITEIQDAPYGLTGAGVKVGVFEADEYGSEMQHNVSAHADLADRLTVKDTEGLVSTHATQVAGTIASSGGLNPSGKGMASGAAIVSYGIGTDAGAALMKSEAGSNNINMANCSFNQRGSGAYGEVAASWDQVVIDTAMPIFNSAGDYQQNPNGSDRTLGSYATAKNIMTVGATDEVDAMSYYSSWGPCSDGRVKPDLVADGNNLRSTIPGSTYAKYYGTSAASAVACGGGALLYQQFLTATTAAPSPSMLKALMIHGATDLGTTGPDYKYGWGLFNARRSADLIKKNQFVSGAYDGATPVTYDITVPDGAMFLKATLVWSDPTGTVGAVKALQNDLNLRIKESGFSYMPYVLDPMSPDTPASTGNNTADNVEQVLIRVSPGSTAFTLEVSGTLAVGTSQEFSLVCEGLAPDVSATRELVVQADNAVAVPITMDTTDVDGNKDGNSSFIRYFFPGTTVTLAAAEEVPSRKFDHWHVTDVDGRNEDITDVSITLDMSTNITATAVYINHADLIVTPEPLSILEGREKSVTVKLSVQPPWDVEVNVTKVDGGDPDLNVITPMPIIFTTDDYASPHTVTFKATHDRDLNNGTAQFLFSGPDVTDHTLDVTEIDDDINGYNDLFDNRKVITKDLGSSTINNVIYTREQGEPLIYCSDYKALRQGGRSAWWEWTAPVTGQVEFNTKGSAINTLLGVYTGDAFGNLKWVAGDDDSGGSFTSKLSFWATAGTTYIIAADGFKGVAGTIVLNWVVDNPINVAVPNGDDIWHPGETQSIIYSINPKYVTTYVKIYLYKDDVFYKTICAGTVPTGVYNWTIPTDLPESSKYRIHVLSSDKVYRDFSYKTFTITNEPYPIKLLHPMGGETFTAGQKVTLQYTTSGVAAGGNVKFYLYHGGDYVRAINGGTSNTGTYDWIVPSDIPSDKNYRIAVLSVQAPVRDYNDTVFTIYNKPAVQVTAPNGGEVYKPGASINIKWSSDKSRLGKDVKIYLYKAGVYVTSISKSTANDGSFTWVIPATQTLGNDYTIAVMSLDKGIRDYSDKSFTITK